MVLPLHTQKKGVKAILEQFLMSYKRFGTKKPNELHSLGRKLDTQFWCFQKLHLDFGVAIRTWKNIAFAVFSIPFLTINLNVTRKNRTIGTPAFRIFF